MARGMVVFLFIWVFVSIVYSCELKEGGEGGTVRVVMRLIVNVLYL